MKTTKILAETAVATALSVLLGFIPIMKMPQGGSVSLTMLPILLLSFRRGCPAGITAGVLYGAISLIFDGYIFHPMSILLDYILAFGIVGIAGFFPKKLPTVILGACISVFGRFLSSLVSGAVFFAEYAPAGQNPWIYSAVYQATYLLPELVICLTALIIIFLKAPSVFNPSR